MRRIDLLISEARQETNNVIFTDDTGIQDSEFLRWSNSAQMRLLSLIQQAHPDLFQRETIVQAIQGQEEYDIPANTFLGTRVQNIEYSRTKLTEDYYLLKKGFLKERVNGPTGTPSFYIRFSNQFFCQPSPATSGSFRVISQLALPRLDIRRAVVASSVLDGSTNSITSLILNTSLDIADQMMIAESYICIVDKDGAILMEGIPISDVNITTGVVTIDPGFSYISGESIPAGSFVVLGQYSSTHSQLPIVAERYLVEMMIWKCAKRDANAASQEQSSEIAQIENEIVASYAEPDEDISFVAVLNSEYMDTDTYK